MNLKSLFDKKQNLGEHAILQARIARAVQGGRIVFDTNVLLNFYVWTDEDLESIFAAFSGEIGSRLWVPHQVALEYSFLRNIRSKEERNRLIAAKNSFLSVVEKFSGNLLQPLWNVKLLKQDDMGGLPDIKTTLGLWYEDLIAEIDSKISALSRFDIIEHDSIFNNLNEILEDRVGAPFISDRMANVLEQGKNRYEFKIAPGYADFDKKDKKFKEGKIDPLMIYGDFIIWEQMIEFALEDGAKYVVFVTEDFKEDWVHNETKAILPILFEEFLKRTGKEIVLLNFSDFLEVSARVGALNTVPVEKMGNLMRSVIEKDLNRLEEISRGEITFIIQQNRLISSAQSNFESRSEYWINKEQWSGQANQLFVGYNRDLERWRGEIAGRRILIENKLIDLQKLVDRIQKSTDQLGLPPSLIVEQFNQERDEFNKGI